MARSLGRPLRYFIAKKAAGPVLVVADRIDVIHTWLEAEGLADQFHPSYTRMVPAHHLMELALVGCPDPNPVCRRFFTPERNRWVDFLRAVSILAVVCGHWLMAGLYVDEAGTLQRGDLLSVSTWAHWLTWVFQVMPVFFLVGGNWLVRHRPLHREFPARRLAHVSQSDERSVRRRVASHMIELWL